MLVVLGIPMVSVELGSVLAAVFLIVAARWLYLGLLSCWRGHRPTVIHHPDSQLGRRLAQTCSALRDKCVYNNSTDVPYFKIERFLPTLWDR